MSEEKLIKTYKKGKSHFYLERYLNVFLTNIAFWGIRFFLKVVNNDHISLKDVFLFPFLCITIGSAVVTFINPLLWKDIERRYDLAVRIKSSKKVH